MHVYRLKCQKENVPTNRCCSQTCRSRDTSACCYCMTAALIMTPTLQKSPCIIVQLSCSQLYTLSSYARPIAKASWGFWRTQFQKVHLWNLLSRISPFHAVTVKPLMFACPLFREFRKPNKAAKLKGANVNCRPKIAQNLSRQLSGQWN